MEIRKTFSFRRGKDDLFLRNIIGFLSFIWYNGDPPPDGMNPPLSLFSRGTFFFPFFFIFKVPF